MSSASQTISNQLSSSTPSVDTDMSMCQYNVMRLIMWSVIFIITCCCISSLMARSMRTDMSTDYLYDDTLSYRHPVMLQHKKSCGMKYIQNNENIENFNNNYDKFEYLSYSNSEILDYQSVALTAPTINGQYTNLTFGKANRHIYNNNVIYDISADLYVLNGNIYDQANDNIPLSYTVQLVNETANNIIMLGEMKKDNDGIYKLNVKSTNSGVYQGYKKIQIVYKRGDKSEVLLEGKFK